MTAVPPAVKLSLLWADLPEAAVVTDAVADWVIVLVLSTGFAG